MSLLPEKRELAAFTRQVGQARDRKIEFNFTFDEWRAWWIEQLGSEWMSRRGRTKGSFQMARIGDVGAYELSNVKCVTVSENCLEQRHDGERNGRAKLTSLQAEEARRLYIPRSKEFGVRALARKYGVMHATMGACLRRETWV